jgi:hypothetical protein
MKKTVAQKCLSAVHYRRSIAPRRTSREAFGGVIFFQEVA